MLDGIFYILRTGAPWRDLPERWPLHHGLQPVQSLGQSGCVGSRVRGAGARFAEESAADRQLDCARPSTLRGREKEGCEAIGRSRGGLTTKIHALVDERGLPLRLALTPGQAHDVTAVRDLLDQTMAVELIEQQGGRANIPFYANRKPRRAFDAAFYKQRNLIERFFNKLKHFRRIATRYEKTARNFLALAAIAATRLWLKFESTT